MNSDELYKEMIRAAEMTARTGLPASIFADPSDSYSYSTASAYITSYNPPESKKIYLGMYVYVEEWPISYVGYLSSFPISMKDLIHTPLGVKCFKKVEHKDKYAIVPYPEYAFELGGTIIEDNLTPLKGIIDALKRSEEVHDYWYVLCASLQRYNAKFQPGRGLVIL